MSIHGKAHVDGGLHSPTNADVVLADRRDLVTVSSPVTVARGAARPRADLGVVGLNPMAQSRIEDVLTTAAASTRARLEAQPALVARLS